MKKTKKRDYSLMAKMFIKSMLNDMGFKSEKDYVIRENSLLVYHQKEMMLIAINQCQKFFPMCNFYWDSARMVVWF